jgi:FtsP/CotA-like multicopper oxidase with cupredoxin domain
MAALADRFNRRRLMRALGLAGAGAAVAPAALAVSALPAAAEAAHAQPAAAQAAMTADEMDAMHEAGVKSYPAPTEGLGGQPLAFTMDGGVKVFDLVCQVVQWEFLPGKRVEAFAYNGVVPGPEIRVTEGDRVRINVANELPQSTAVHWHGLITPNAMDGVPFLTQPPIKPGETFRYEFDIRDGNAGTHMYHSHHNAAEQVTKGLLGAFIVEPRLPGDRPMFNKEYTIVLNDGPIGGFSLNGKSFPRRRLSPPARGRWCCSGS